MPLTLKIPTGDTIEAKDYKTAYAVLKSYWVPHASDSFFRSMLSARLQRDLTHTPPALIVMIMVAGASLLPGEPGERLTPMDNAPVVDPDKLKAGRESTRLTQPEVGFLFGFHSGIVIDFTTVSAHENGRRTVSREQAEVYAKIYKVPVISLYRG